MILMMPVVTKIPVVITNSVPSIVALTVENLKTRIQI